MRRTLSLLAKLRSLVGKTVFKSLGLSDLASLDVAAPRAVMETPCGGRNLRYWSILLTS